MKIEADVYLVDAISKNGNKYSKLEVYYTEKSKKDVFLNDAEKELIEMRMNKKENK